ncbi:hypothetical protein SLE2022_134200 [Rubroshorea leprosula]
MKKSRKAPAFMPELVTDILLRLPVETLLRFRCLSTSLCAEIDSPDFAKNHLCRSIQSKTRQKLIINNEDFVDPTDFFYANFDSNFEYTILLNNPLKSSYRCTSVCGSCNGLFLLGIFVKDQTMDFALWNPFTKRYRKLPPCPVQTLPGYKKFISFGLGCDSALNDYKTVMIAKIHDSNDDDDDHDDCVHFQVWVFSLKSDSWKRIQDVEDELTTWVGSFANGALYWGCENKFVGFDLANEVFFDLPLLNDCGPAAIYYDIEVVFGGNVYTPITHAEEDTIEFYLWVDDDGGEVAGGCWRKEFTLEKEKNISFSLFPPFPLAYSKEGDGILLHKGNLIYWYNFETKKRRRVKIHLIPDIPTYNFHVCWESLVSPGNNTAFDGEAEEVILGDLEADSDE